MHDASADILQVDCKKLAGLAGYTEGSASVTWGKIRRKLKALGEDRIAASGGEVPSPNKPRASPKKRKVKVDGNDESTPTKKGKKAAMKIDPFDDEEEEEEDEPIVKPEPELEA